MYTHSLNSNEPTKCNHKVLHDSTWFVKAICVYVYLCNLSERLAESRNHFNYFYVYIQMLWQ